MENFHEFDLPSALADSLVQMKYTTPTPIQAQAIPLALEGRDILGSAQTGTGKTAAFGIPMLAQLINDPRGSGIVLTPTRELATQVMKVMRELIGNNRKIRTALLIGGGHMGKQFNDLKAGPHIIVGTPGRVNDHLKRGTLKLNNARFLVLDETDRMLDMGFGIQIDAIVKFIPKNRQTLMFSATIPTSIVRLSQKYLQNPERIAVDPVSTPAPKIKQDIIRVSQADKYTTLLSELDAREGSILVFVKTKRGADQLAGQLNRKDYNSKAIHGDLRQNQRDRVIRGFRNQAYRIMIATDVASRGLDIPHIKHVINYDLPECPEDYIHRIGRTARAGAEGSALCLISPHDRGKWNAIDYMLNPDKAKSGRKKPSGKLQRSFGRKPRKNNKSFGFKKTGRSKFAGKKAFCSA